MLFGVVMLGASAGSTSGSIKLIRHITIAKMLRREIDQTLHPEVVAPLRVNRAVVDERALRAIIVFVFLYLGVCVAGSVAVLIDSTLRDIDVSAFQSLTAAGDDARGAGPSLGFAGPMGSFAPFSDLAKLVLTALMYLGRLEIVPVLVLFTASLARFAVSGGAQPLAEQRVDDPESRPPRGSDGPGRRAGRRPHAASGGRAGARPRARGWRARRHRPRRPARPSRCGSVGSTAPGGRPGSAPARR